VAGSHPEALVAALEEGDGEALLALALEEVVGVLEVDADSDDAGDGSEGDVALLESGTNAKDCREERAGRSERRGVNRRPKGLMTTL
jgi:hypothetical protein